MRRRFSESSDCGFWIFDCGVMFDDWRYVAEVTMRRNRAFVSHAFNCEFRIADFRGGQLKGDLPISPALGLGKLALDLHAPCPLVGPYPGPVPIYPRTAQTFPAPRLDGRGD